MLKSAGGGGGGSPVTPGGSTGAIQYNNAGAFDGLADGTAGQVLTSGGAGSPPAWAAAPVLQTTGAALSAGPMTQGQTATVSIADAAAQPGMVAVCNPNNDPGDGFVWDCYIPSSGYSVICRLTCTLAAGGTPASIYFYARVLP